MTTEERFKLIETTQERTAQNLDRLAQVTTAIAESVAAHDDQIEKLVAVAEIQQQRWEQLQREWQAYLTTIHPRQ
jgi:hypothetical protein